VRELVSCMQMKRDVSFLSYFSCGRDKLCDLKQCVGYCMQMKRDIIFLVTKVT